MWHLYDKLFVEVVRVFYVIIGISSFLPHNIFFSNKLKGHLCSILSTDIEIFQNRQVFDLVF